MFEFFFVIDGPVVSFGNGASDVGDVFIRVFKMGFVGFSSGFEGLFSVFGGVFLSFSGNLLLDFGIWVQFEQSGVVLEWVLLLVGVLEGGLSGVSDDGLDLIGVDDSGQIGVAHAGSVEGVSGFLGSVIFEGSEDGVQGFEGGSGVDAESSDLTTWGQLQNVESVDVADFDSWNVSNGSG